MKQSPMSIDNKTQRGGIKETGMGRRKITKGERRRGSRGGVNSDDNGKEQH